MDAVFAGFNQGWAASDEVRVRSVFRNNWHSLAARRGGIDTTAVCDREGCTNRVASRIMVNVWGTVVEYDVCPAHAWYHGKLVDDFPTKKVGA